MKEMKMIHGHITLLDDEEYGRVTAEGKWHTYADQSGVLRVKRAGPMVDGKQTTIYLHRFILGLTDPAVQADHKDRNGLNNQRYNLRPCTKDQNIANTGLPKNNNSGFKGVVLQTDYKGLIRCIAQIAVNGQHFYLGSFTLDRITDAAYAYDDAAVEGFGEFACTNVMLGLLPPKGEGVVCSKVNIFDHSKKCLSSNNTSGFRGIHWNKISQKWQCQISVEGVQHHLGMFPKDQLIEAALAYNVAAVKYFGKFACLNIIPTQENNNGFYQGPKGPTESSLAA